MIMKNIFMAMCKIYKNQKNIFIFLIVMEYIKIIEYIIGE